ncbi:MAG: hypothetical protein ABNH49_06530 [Hyphomonas sp.]|jgi:hypothetical protein|uniref:hypothetical protein n=1 Tax=Hyphomonas sp. TaxID=87 RepID=UPI002624F0F9|nr:hypothetical protein [Hyphomonas sp.]MDF1806852.1 hypothetical protein [Hyphomonas sp.]
MTNRVKIRLGNLLNGASHLGPKRAPAGARGKIPKTTLIRGEDDGLMVETAFLGTRIEILSGSWDKEVEVPDRGFLDLLSKAVKAWDDVGGKNAIVHLSTAGHTLKIVWKDGPSKRMLTINTLRKLN